MFKKKLCSTVYCSYQNKTYSELRFIMTSIAYLKTAIHKLLPGEDPVLVGVQLVEGHLHVVPQLPGAHLHVGGGGHQGQGLQYC
jgi:hypothetical protein